MNDDPATIEGETEEKTKPRYRVPAKLQEDPKMLPQTVTPMHMLQVAMDEGADLKKMEQLMDLHERWEKNEARKAYVLAMSEFKTEPLEISKNIHVQFQTTKGLTSYDHASLDHVASVVSKAMSKHGLSFRWDVSQETGILVTCIVTHCLGHSESLPLKADADSSGGKNSIQAIGSAITYLQRYTLLGVTGLAAKGQDNDGATAGEAEIELITDEQRSNLIAAFDENGIDEVRWLKYNKLESVSDIQTQHFQAALNSIKKTKASE